MDGWVRVGGGDGIMVGSLVGGLMGYLGGLQGRYVGCCVDDSGY